MIAIRPRRSALYMPGSHARAIEKAKTLPADAVIFDLEDAVAPEAKAEARDAVCAAVKTGGYGRRERVIRINGLDTAWGEADLAAAAAAAPDAVLLPKVSGPEDVLEAGRRLDALGAPGNVHVWTMIETPLAILQAKEIAAVARDETSRLTCFVMGTNDLAKDTRARLNPGRAAMMAWLMTALAAARAYGIDILDGVYNSLSDEAGFRTECIEGRNCGFDGKTLIHPSQIAVANEVFAPSAEEVESARAIAALFEQPENLAKGAVSHNGRMVERLHAQMAKRTLALAEAIASSSSSPALSR